MHLGRNIDHFLTDLNLERSDDKQSVKQVSVDDLVSKMLVEDPSKKGLVMNWEQPVIGECEVTSSNLPEPRFRYVGQFQAHKNHSQGTFTFASGARYEGQFQADQKHGQGTYTLADGTRYEGQFQADKYHGQGTCTFASGARFEGQWKQGEWQG